MKEVFERGRWRFCLDIEDEDEDEGGVFKGLHITVAKPRTCLTFFFFFVFLISKLYAWNLKNSKLI